MELLISEKSVFSIKDKSIFCVKIISYNRYYTVYGLNKSVIENCC